MTQTLNYIKSRVHVSELIKPKNHTQVPFEVITSIPNVSYRIYAGGDSFSDMDILIERLKQETLRVSSNIGNGFFLADIKFVSPEVWFEKHTSSDYTPISSVVIADAVNELKLEEMSLIKEKCRVLPRR